MKSLSGIFTRSVVFALLLTAGSALVEAQKPAKAAPPEESMLEAYGLYLAIIAIIGLIGAVVVMRKKSEGSAASAAAASAKTSDDGFTLKFTKKERVRETAPVHSVATKPVPAAVLAASKTGFGALPVSTFSRIQRTNAFIQLPESRDHDLLEAIELTNEESEADAHVRTNALKLLSSFKTSNSVSAIAQIALYDLSSKLRSDAVSVLAAMDHESVFETIVTACADPTREVRAAAARGLFKLTFDRAHAWARVIESGDAARMRHVARCAIEGDLVERSIDRLANADRKVAYEAFTLTALLIRAGETDPVYKAVAEHRDENVKLALLHVLLTLKDENTFDSLSNLLTSYNLSPNIAAKVNEVRSCLQMTHA